MEGWSLFRRLFQEKLIVGSPARRLAALGLPLLFLGATITLVRDLPAQWRLLSEEYSWNTENVEEMNVALGRWVSANLPQGATVGVMDGGALRYFGGRRSVDLVGLNTHRALGYPPYQVAEENRVDYMVTWRDRYGISLANATEVYRKAARRNTILGWHEASVLRMSWDAPFSEKSLPQTLPTHNLRLLDSLDLGDPGAEREHNYSAAQNRILPPTPFKVSAERAVRDEGRVQRAPGGRDTFAVRSTSGKDLILAARYDAFLGGVLQVYANDTLVGEWRLRESQFAFGEDTFIIPARFVTAESTRLTLEYVASARGEIAIYYYWTFEPI